MSDGYEIYFNTTIFERKMHSTLDILERPPINVVEATPKFDEIIFSIIFPIEVRQMMLPNYVLRFDHVYWTLKGTV